MCDFEYNTCFCTRKDKTVSFGVDTVKISDRVKMTLEHI